MKNNGTGINRQTSGNYCSRMRSNSINNKVIKLIIKHFQQYRTKGAEVFSARLAEVRSCLSKNITMPIESFN